MRPSPEQNPAGPSGTVAGGDQINEQHISTTDWSLHCLPIGVKMKEARPWEGATHSDLRILAAMLLKPLTLVTPNGIVQSPPLADSSEFLRQLGVWAKGAAEWCAANPSKVP